MARQRMLWMAKDANGIITLFSSKPIICECDGTELTFNGWAANGWNECVNEILPHSDYRKIVSKTIKKPWRESLCRVSITIKEV